MHVCNRSCINGRSSLPCRSVFEVEKRLELVKQVSHSTHKKLTACLQGQQGVDVDKKSVRSPSVRQRNTTHLLSMSLLYCSTVMSAYY